MRKYRNHNGFTLIELSIVLVIIGIIVGMVAQMVGPLTAYIRVRETKELQDATVQAIISWTASRNTLPTKDEFTGIAKSPRDAWGQLFAYKYYSSISRASSSKDTICGRRTTPLKLYTNYTTASVAFAIISRGDSSDFKSTFNGTLITDSGPTPAGFLNAGGTNVDIIRWVTLDELRSKIGCQGPALKIVNTSLAAVSAGYVNPVTIRADGGVPFTAATPYQWCISPVLPGAVEAYFAPALTTQASCSPTGSSGWVLGDKVTITGAALGSYSFTVNVRDNDGNFAQRLFDLLVQ